MKCKCGIEIKFSNGIDIVGDNILSRVVCPNCGKSMLLHYTLDFSLFYNDEDLESLEQLY